MTKQKDAKPPRKSQRERFIEAARKVEADETGAKFERAFKKLVPPKKGKPATTQN